VYSLNVPVPVEAARLASEVARSLPDARPRRRGQHTLVAKRLGNGDHSTFARLSARAREAIEGTPPFAARVTGVDYFQTAASGPSPVVYLAVESPGLSDLHATLAATFDPVDDIEGEDYVPHITVARGGTLATVQRLADRDIDPVSWDVTELTFWDGERSQPTGTVSLPA